MGQNDYITNLSRIGELMEIMFESLILMKYTFIYQQILNSRLGRAICLQNDVYARLQEERTRISTLELKVDGRVGDETEEMRPVPEYNQLEHTLQDIRTLIKTLVVAIETGG